jgi:chloride channel protein, CIC family
MEVARLACAQYMSRARNYLPPRSTQRVAARDGANGGGEPPSHAGVWRKASRGALASLRRSVASGSTGLTVLALVVGIGAGGGAVGFRYMILGLTHVFTGHSDYSAAGHAADPWVPGLGIYFVVLTPVIGGLLYGPLVSLFAPEARGHGVPEVMYAVNRLGGRMRAQVPVIKSLASALCIGCGGSVGREGPIVQIGSALGSMLGQVIHVSESQLRLLVACGAAGGISATFNAPIAGVFFALELILRNFETRSFGLVVLSSVTADAIGRAAFGTRAFLSLPAFSFGSPFELVLYAGLGVVACAAGILLVRTVYGAEDLADRVWGSRPDWLRPAAGGILLGLLLLAVPQMYGVGYPVLERSVAGHYLILALLGLMAAKILATSLTLSIGGSGGVFAPSLFIGATVGTAYGIVAHDLLPGLAETAGAYGLVGMGAVFAATARAPITSVLVIFELTGDYRIIPPLMFAVVVATALSNAITRDTIYTLKLRRRGIDIEAPTGMAALATTQVATAMGAPPAALDADAPLDATLALLSEQDVDTLPVLSADGSLLGVLTAAAVESALGERDGELTAGSLARTAPELRACESLEDAVRALAANDEDGLPVLADEGRAMVGWMTHRRLLRATRSLLVPPTQSRSVTAEHAVSESRSARPIARR